MSGKEPPNRAASIGTFALAALVAAVWGLLTPTLDRVGYQPLSDDGYYLRYMQELVDKGPAAFPDQFQFYLGDQKHWIFPSPSRMGFTIVSALFALVFGASLSTLSYVSLASHLALIVVTFVFTRRWLETSMALLAAALVAFSPLYLGLSRLALTDSLISLCQVTVLFLFIEYVRAPERRWCQVAFALTFTFTLLTKEISGLLVVPFVVYAAIERYHRRRDVPVLRTAMLLVAPVIATVILWILAAGGPTPLVRVIEITLTSPATNAYHIQYGSGGWYRYLIDELLMSPWPTLLGLAGVAVTFWRWGRQEYSPLPVALALVYVGQIAVLGFFIKSLRYVAVLEVPLRVLGVVLLWDALRASTSSRGRIACFAIVALLCWLDYRDFESLWLDRGLYDPVTAALLTLRGILVQVAGAGR
jgi:4-amino-4-deoxy-L-arabinose transferase-like glycosyltransferase